MKNRTQLRSGAPHLAPLLGLAVALLVGACGGSEDGGSVDGSGVDGSGVDGSGADGSGADGSNEPLDTCSDARPDSACAGGWICDEAQWVCGGSIGEGDGTGGNSGSSGGADGGGEASKGGASTGGAASGGAGGTGTGGAGTGGTGGGGIPAPAFGELWGSCNDFGDCVGPGATCEQVNTAAGVRRICTPNWVSGTSCDPVTDCPAPPAGISATVECLYVPDPWNACILHCTDDADCPTGYTCQSGAIASSSAELMCLP